MLRVDTLDESLQLLHFCQPQPCQPEQLTDRVPIPLLQTEREVTLTSVVDVDQYRVYLDGELVIDLSYSEVGPRPTPLGVSAFGRIGVVRVIGARVYEMLSGPSP